MTRPDARLSLVLRTSIEGQIERLMLDAVAKVAPIDAREHVTGSGQGNRVTLKDVAALARVDASVVSRLVNEDPHLSIRDETRARVMDAVKKLNYQPNLAARALRTSRGTLLAFVVPELANPLYAQLVTGAAKRAQANGYSVVLLEDDKGRLDLNILQTFQQRGIEGLVVAGGTLDEKTLRRFRELELPLVVVNRKIEGVPWALVDDDAGTRVAARHLVDLGHRQIALLGGPKGLDTTERRAHALADELKAHGAEISQRIHAPTRAPVAGAEAMRALLEVNAGTTAVFADSAMLGIGALNGAKASGFRIPEDLSVVALHDLEFADYTSPTLTTVALPMEELGALAVSQLIERARGQEPASLALDIPPRLRIRESTTPPA